MFDIAWSEFLVVAVVALVVVGPKDLPALLRTVGKTIASLRRMAGEFQGQFNEAMREAELDGLKDELTGMKDKASRMVGASPFQIARDEIKNALTDKPKSTPSALAGDEGAAKVDADAPSALAPPPPIEATPEPPAPTPADFGIKAAPAMRPTEPVSEPQPAAARQAARKAASGAASAETPAPRKRAPAKAAVAKAAAPKPSKAKSSEAAPEKPRKPAAKKKTEQTPPGASA